jgi:hypothetical protein
MDRGSTPLASTLFMIKGLPVRKIGSKTNNKTMCAKIQTCSRSSVKIFELLCARAREGSMTKPMAAGLASLRTPGKQWWPLTKASQSRPTSPSHRWCQKMLGVQRWQDVRIWGDAVPLWFPAYRARQPTVSHHAGELFCAFPSLFCRPSGSLRPNTVTNK